MNYSRMEVLLFGIAKDIVGKRRVAFLDDGARPLTVKDLKVHLRKNYPEFGKLSSMAIAVNNEYAQDDRALAKNDEIAVIPPVSGG